MAEASVDPGDRAEVAELLARYAEAIDEGAFDVVGELFAEAVLEDGEGHTIARGADEVAALYAATTRRHADGTPMTTHLVTNVIVEPAAPGELEVRSRFCVLQATSELPLQPVVVGRYLDRVARRGDRWVFVRRRMLPEQWGDTSQHLRIDPPARGATRSGRRGTGVSAS